MVTASHPPLKQRASPHGQRPALVFALSLLLLCAGAVVAPPPAQAQHDASIFRDADIPLGEKLIAENKCAECHIRKFGGDGTSIYRPKGRINTAGFLRGMVEQCNTELKLQLFPEEVTAIAAVLNRDFYRFK